MPNHVTTTTTVSGPAADRAALIALMVHPEKKHDGSEELCFDFDRIIPMPKCLEGSTSGGHVEIALALLAAQGEPQAAAALRQTTARARSYGFPDAGDPIKKYLAYPWVREAGISEAAQLAPFLSERSSGDIFKEGRQALAAFIECGYTDWYDWSIAHWGTKWNAYAFADLREGPTTTRFRFDTAWSFPEPVFLALSARFPTLSFKCVWVDEGGPEGEEAYDGVAP